MFLNSKKSQSNMCPVILLGLLGFVLCCFTTACAPKVMLPGKAVTDPILSNGIFFSFDQTPLPYKKWLPKNKPIKNIIIALHGFNDYSNFFEDTGSWLAQFGVASFAYDQRGFGESPNNGLWAGSLAMQNDLKMFINVIKQRHPDIPIYVLGESMGGAVVMTAMTMSNTHKVNDSNVSGLILVAPAVWGKQTMPWYQRLSLIHI